MNIYLNRFEIASSSRCLREDGKLKSELFCFVSRISPPALVRLFRTPIAFWIFLERYPEKPGQGTDGAEIRTKLCASSFRNFSLLQILTIPWWRDVETDVRTTMVEWDSCSFPEMNSLRAKRYPMPVAFEKNAVAGKLIKWFVWCLALNEWFVGELHYSCC